MTDKSLKTNKSQIAQTAKYKLKCKPVLIQQVTATKLLPWTSLQSAGGSAWSWGPELGRASCPSPCAWVSGNIRVRRICRPGEARPLFRMWHTPCLRSYSHTSPGPHRYLWPCRQSSLDINGCSMFFHVSLAPCSFMGDVGWGARRLSQNRYMEDLDYLSQVVAIQTPSETAIRVNTINTL